MGFFIGEVYYALESPVGGAISLLNDRWRTNNEVLQSYTLPKCYGSILREEGKTLLRKYIIAKKEGAYQNNAWIILNRLKLCWETLY